MRDIESTPIVRYTGPRGLRKALELEGRKFLGYVKGVLGAGLSNKRYIGRYSDGTTIEVASLSNCGVVDIIRIVVPTRVAAEGAFEQKEKSVLTKVDVVEIPVPMLVLNDREDIQAFMSCKALMEKTKYPQPAGGVCDGRYNKPYGGVCDGRYYKPYGAVMGDVAINSLRPISDPDCRILGMLTQSHLTFMYNDEPVGLVKEIGGSDNFVIAAAVVHGDETYKDYETYGVIYATTSVPVCTPASSGRAVTAWVTMAFCDPDKGLRKYHLETHAFPRGDTFADVKGVGAIHIFDYYGKPYFVASYCGITGWWIG